ncbi:uncharacterized protein N7483_006485 [Penicillium malachiteum]|uniref:uncharacterized protein n=1 Tax=Penicillium malachiteum TaxID=1324776 RepID=UPI002548F9B8|nr:uncharacterized protein N7483_006485 [Penicillium malachiteum]KAJ5725128.1 hypothetical protein N7483_006485 [Penicillium malachiteum]
MSKDHSQAPSERAVLAFMAGCNEFYQQCKPLVHPLLNFLENEFDLKLGHQELDLPMDTFEENPTQKHIREAIVPLLMAEFREKGCEFDEIKDHDIFIAAFHWFVNYDRAVSVFGFESKHPKTRHPGDLVLRDPAISAKLFKVSHHLARVLAYDSTGRLPKYAPLGSRFAPESFYGERGTYSDEDGSTHGSNAEIDECDNAEEKELPEY